MSQQQGVQRPPSICTGSQQGLVLIASGKQPPCAAEAGVDVQAGAVKRMDAAACQLHQAWLQHADCSSR